MQAKPHSKLLSDI